MSCVRHVPADTLVHGPDGCLIVAAAGAPPNAGHQLIQRAEACTRLKADGRGVRPAFSAEARELVVNIVVDEPRVRLSAHRRGRRRGLAWRCIRPRGGKLALQLFAAEGGDAAGRRLVRAAVHGVGASVRDEGRAANGSLRKYRCFSDSVRVASELAQSTDCPATDGSSAATAARATRVAIGGGTATPSGSTGCQCTPPPRAAPIET
jgi:hypothetical protein